jgi:hypothetical protein
MYEKMNPDVRQVNHRIIRTYSRKKSVFMTHEMRAETANNTKNMKILFLIRFEKKNIFFM